MSTAERKQFIDPSVLEAVKRLQRRDTAAKLAEALRAFVEWGHQYEDEGMDEWTAQVLNGARAALAEWDAQS